MNIIIEGVDRLGKGTLIAGLKANLGATVHLHYQKPELLKHYIDMVEADGKWPETAAHHLKCEAQRLYQLDSFSHMFHMLDNVEFGLILDRAHLGEMVYAPRYRNYCGDYVLELEKRTCVSITKDVLVLLMSSDMSFLEDDGLSFDFNAKESEQDDFIAAFAKSAYKNKIQIDICLRDEAGVSLKQYAPAQDILNVLLRLKPIGLTQRYSFKLIDGTVETIAFIEDPEAVYIL
jgi:hypothetical protein